MSLASYGRSLAARLFRREHVDADLDDEVRSHLQLRADDLERAGLSRAEAERRARVEFGGQLRFKEEVRGVMGGEFFETLSQDVRFGLRMLRKSPSFTAVAVFTLALTIGANAVVFAALNAIILKPLNVPRAESLYSLHRINNNSANVSYPDYVDFRDRNHSFESLAGYSFIQGGLDAGGDPARVWMLGVTGNYFDALGLRPHLGRFLHASDEHGPNSAPYVVLSYSFWHRQFADDPGVVGRVVKLNKHPFTVIGVAPRGFIGTLLFFAPDLFAPLVDQEQLEGKNALDARADRNSVFMTFGHLKPGVTPEQAAADFSAIDADLARTYPKDHGAMKYKLGRPGLYGEFLGGPIRAFLTALMLLSTLILLAACANLGSLFAARAADRSKELALRLALGAGRGRLLRQLFTEAILVSLIGGALGLGASALLLRALHYWQPVPQFPLNMPIDPDPTVCGVALLLAVLSGIAFGAVPVRQVLETDPYETLKSGPAGRATRRLTVRDVLLVAQIAICAVLVTSSLVAVRGLERSMRTDFGFEPRNTMLLQTKLEMAGYRGDARLEMQKRMVETMAAIPGVTAVGLSDRVPLTTGDLPGVLVFKDQETDLRPANSATATLVLEISPSYLRAANTTLLAGRAPTWDDDAGAPPVAVINAELARKLFGSPDAAIGRFLKQRDGTRTQVVGVTENGKYENLTESPQSMMFLSIAQAPTGDVTLIVRSSADPVQLAAAMRSALRKLDDGLPCFIQPWARSMDMVLFPARLAAVSLGVLGVMAALLSLTGIFGLAAYAVSRRLKEVGIRMALGARGSEVLRATLARPFTLFALGSGAGLVLGFLASGVLRSLVYEATPRDPLVLGGVVVVMLLLGFLATWIPAQRALAVDPLRLLREE